MNSQDIMNNIAQLLQNASNEDLKDLINNVHQTMNKRAEDEKMIKFSERIIEKANVKSIRYVRILESKNNNAIVYAPTQVGKSAAMVRFIETCFKYNVIFK